MSKMRQIISNTKLTSMGQPVDITAHKMVAYVAEQMAGEEYEVLARDNEFYKSYPNQKSFIRYRAPYLRKVAREILGGMLARNDVSDIEKNSIFEALTLDNMLPKSGVGVIKK